VAKTEGGAAAIRGRFRLDGRGNFSAVEGLILASILQRCRQVSPFVGLDEGGRGV